MDSHWPPHRTQVFELSWPEIPADLLRFLESNIDSIEQLELLRLLGESPDREWVLPELAVRVQASPSLSAQHAATLERRGLIRSHTDGNGTRWKLGSLSAETETLVRRFLQLYNERPVTLIKLVYARAAQDPLKAFADAFRLRRDG
jgi:DNA-binding MarR family transcriptional regulator